MVANYAGALAGLELVNVGLTFANAYMQAEAYKAQGRYEKAVADYNAATSYRQARDALRRSQRVSTRLLGRGRQIAGAQAAAQAAGGVQVGFGSARAARDETAKLSALDALEARKNGYLEAWGYESRAIQHQFQGQMARLSAQTAARGTYATALTQSSQSAARAGYGFILYGSGPTYGSEGTEVRSSLRTNREINDRYGGLV